MLFAKELPTGRERRAYKRIAVEDSSLPETVPSGSVCNAREVSTTKQLKRGDLILVLTNGSYQPRRFLREKEGWAYVADESNNNSISMHTGNFFRVFEIYKGSSQVKMKRASGSVFWKWARSFF